jgi:uncharacterized protein Yka (UPF0111/DUF47 family)
MGHHDPGGRVGGGRLLSFLEVDHVKRSWFLPASLDVIGMLRSQAAVTLEGLEAVVAWAGGEPAAAELIREREHDADDRKRDLRKALTESFLTPLDAEDLYMMSKHLDDVINGAKDAVRESEVMALAPDEHVLGMARCLLEGVRRLDEAFGLLPPDAGHEAGTATDAADGAIKAQRQLERVYRSAMSALLDVDDLREVMARRELYRRFSRIGDSVVEAAERVWYSTVKEG